MSESFSPACKGRAVGVRVVLDMPTNVDNTQHVG